MKKTFSGIVPDSVEGVTPVRKDFEVPPQNRPSLPKAIEYPITSHTIEANTAMPKHCIKTDNTFFDVTSPP